MAYTILDLYNIGRFQDELARARTVLSEGKVSIDTLKEEKPFVAEIIKPGMSEFCISRVY